MSNVYTIYLAGGCFWGVQAYFDLLKGVVETRVGYANSIQENPSYKEVCTGGTNATEAIKLVYNPSIISLDGDEIESASGGNLPDCILSRFFSIINPTALNYQGNDVGTQYRNGIYVLDSSLIDRIHAFISTYIAPRYIKTQEEREECNNTKRLSKIVTEVALLTNFYDAEDYHQKYLEKNPHGYCHVDISRALKPLY